MLLATLVSAQQTVKIQLVITLSIANPVVTLGTRAHVIVVEKNIGSEPAEWSTLCDAIFDFHFAVIGPDGNAVKPTPLLERMLKGPTVTTCTITGTLPPGEEFKSGTELTKYFDMTTSGKYVVQATRDSFSSNKLEITITH